MTGFAILLPILGGIICYLDKAGKFRPIYLSLILGAETIVIAVNAYFRSGELFIINPIENLSIAFNPDWISHILALVCAALFFLVSFYSHSYMEHSKHQRSFYAFYLFTLGGLVGLFYSGNMFTFYMFFELMTLCSTPLVIHDRTKSSVTAGYTYLAYSIFGAGLGLFGMFFMNHYCSGNLDFVYGGTLDMSVVSGHESAVYVVTLLMVLGYSAKAGAYPLNAWLPIAHPVAPAPASALLSGVITKAGVLGAIRMCYFVVGADFIRGTYVQHILIIVSLTTIIMGSVIALKTDYLKKRLAYSSISQVSYVLFGVFLLTENGLYASFYQVIFHAFGKVLLFISVGTIMHMTGKTGAKEMDGVGRALPWTMGAFSVGALTLVGVPPAGGFIAKWRLATSSLDMTHPVLSVLGVLVLIISAILTAAYLFDPVLKGFFSDIGFTERMKENRVEVGVFLILSLVILVGGGIAICL